MSGHQECAAGRLAGLTGGDWCWWGGGGGGGVGMRGEGDGGEGDGGEGWYQDSPLHLLYSSMFIDFIK